MDGDMMDRAERRRQLRHDRREARKYKEMLRQGLERRCDKYGVAKPEDYMTALHADLECRVARAYHDRQDTAKSDNMYFPRQGQSA